MKEGGPLLKASYSLMCLYFIKASLKNVVHETDTFFLEKKRTQKTTPDGFQVLEKLRLF